MVVDIDGSTEKHEKSQLIMGIYSDALHCDMGAATIGVACKNSKNTTAK